MPDPLFCTLFLLAAFAAAGVGQVLWLRSRLARRFARPLDGGATLRGRRLFGDNKTWKGFVVMVPAVGASFLLLGAFFGGERLWALTAAQWWWLGCWSGLGYMLGELPNSFVKRQLDIVPGSPPVSPLGRAVCFVVDQSDSVLGALLALSVFVSVPLATWLAILLAGPVVHWCFNVVLMLTGAKARAA